MENITILNVYIPNLAKNTYDTNTERLQGEIDKHQIKTRDF